MLRAETKRRARALQLLYAWELQGRPPMALVARSLRRGAPAWHASIERAEPLASAVAAEVDRLDAEIAEAAENWRFERIGIVERTLLRLALHELRRGVVPAKVAISEAVRLAHLFAGPKAPGFVNGVLDGLARRAGRL